MGTKNPGGAATCGSPGLFFNSGPLCANDVRRRGPPVGLSNFKFHYLALGQGPKAFTVYCREVDEYVVTLLPVSRLARSRP